MADEDEAADPLARFAECAAHRFRIRAPSGHPAGDIAERVGGKQQVHSRRAARQLLLPQRNLVIGHGGRDEQDELTRVVCEILLLLAMGVGCPRIFSLERMLEECGESVALIVRHDDEAPRMQLAMVRRPRGNGEHAVEFGGGRTRSDKLARLGRAAGFQQREQGRTVVQHQAANRVAQPLQQSASQAGFGRYGRGPLWGEEQMVDTPAVEEPFTPASGKVNPADKGMWFGHPRQLVRLFTTEMWERFGYYGMRALLTLYLTKHFIFSDQQATGLYGGYTALVYLTPLVGGLIADQILGSKRSVKFGAIMMAIGYFTLAFGGKPATPYAVVDGQRYAVQVQNFTDRPTTANEVRYLIAGNQKLQIRGNDDGSVSLLRQDNSVARTVPKGGFESGGDRNPLTVAILLIALSLISVGNGFFKPNISTIVGTLYDQGDRRRDSGFTIFYMGINLGSILGQVACPIVADAIGWGAGFALAGVGMSIAYLLMQFDGGRLHGYGEVPTKDRDRSVLVYIGAIVAVPVFYFLFVNLMNTPEPEPGSGFIGYVASLSLMGKLLFGSFLVGVPVILGWSYAKGTRTEFQMMCAAMVLITFNVFFWTLFEQAGSSL